LIDKHNTTSWNGRILWKGIRGGIPAKWVHFPQAKQRECPKIKIKLKDIWDIWGRLCIL
jgi:hypothetical protein